MFRSVDTSPPLIAYCPSNIVATSHRGTSINPVHWVEPSAIDASMIVKSNRSHTSGDSFPIGSTMVMYRFVSTTTHSTKPSAIFTLILLLVRLDQDPYTRPLVFKFLCTVDFTQRLANQKRLSANFMSFQLSMMALFVDFFLFYRCNVKFLKKAASGEDGCISGLSGHAMSPTEVFPPYAVYSVTIVLQLILPHGKNNNNNK